MTAAASVQITESSGNIFADLGLPEPEELLAKAGLVHRISEIAEERGWDQARVAEGLGIDETTTMRLLHGYLDEFPIEQLFRFLDALDQAVEISVYANRSPDQPAGVVVMTK